MSDVRDEYCVLATHYIHTSDVSTVSVQLAVSSAIPFTVLYLLFFNLKRQQLKTDLGLSFS